MKKESRVTCLLGAGAAIDIGGPTTYAITEKVRNKNNFLKEICDILDQYYGQEGFHFEDIFHAIETLYSYAEKGPRAVKKYKPVLGAFIDQKDSEFFNSYNLIQAKQIILEIIAEKITNYNDTYREAGKEWYENFWINFNSKSRLDIFTLNYDTTIQQVLKQNYTDGFEMIKGESFYRFNLNAIKNSEQTRIMNLHGAINYGFYNGKDHNRFSFEDSFYDLYKFNNYKEAKNTWFHRSSNTTQAGEVAEISPIITGLRKADKLSTYPLSVYNQLLHDSLLTNSSLLVCGYSFGDYHINQVLERMAAAHGKDRKIVLIVYLNDCQKEEWAPDPAVMDWLSQEMFTFIAKAFKEFYPFDRKFEFMNPMVSEDGCVKIYFEGFRNTVEDFGNEIIEFLTQEAPNEKNKYLVNQETIKTWNAITMTFAALATTVAAVSSWKSVVNKKNQKINKKP